MSLRERQSLFAFNFHKLIEFIYSQGFEISFGEFYRPPEMQKIYFNTGRSKTMDGLHPKRLAGDLNFFKNGVMLFQDPKNYIADATFIKPIGEFWMSLNTDNVWGSDWNRNHDIVDDTFHDPYHFECKP